MESKDKTPLAEEIEFVGAGLQNLHHLDAVADALQDISGYLKELAETVHAESNPRTRHRNG